MNLFDMAVWQEAHGPEAEQGPTLLGRVAQVLLRLCGGPCMRLIGLNGLQRTLAPPPVAAATKLSVSHSPAPDMQHQGKGPASSSSLLILFGRTEQILVPFSNCCRRAQPSR